MKLTEQRIYDLLAAFRSSDPTPGGGSASALAGAVGASLLAMVAGLKKSRATTEQDATELQNTGLRCTALAAGLEQLVNEDADAYDVVMAAYRLPKLTDEEKAARAAAIQDGLKKATEVPLEVMRKCGEALGLVAIVERLGNPNAASDVKVARYLLRAGLAGAAENVAINLGTLKDAAYVEQVRDEAAALEKATTDWRLATSD